MEEEEEVVVVEEVEEGEMDNYGLFMDDGFGFVKGNWRSSRS